MLEDAQVLADMEATADPLPFKTGGVPAATQAAPQEPIKQTDKQGALGNLPFSIDMRPISEQLAE